MKDSDVPALRLRDLNDRPIRSDGDYVLYWMVANRRLGWNFSLQRSAAWARELGKPLVILEALRCDYLWASDRFHRFVIQGMADNAAALRSKPVIYYPYLERRRGDGEGLLSALAEQACLVVSDDFPCFFLPRMLAAAARKLPVRLELVDSNGLLPMRVADRAFSRAFDFRRFLQKSLLPHLAEMPAVDPLAGIELPQLQRLPTKVLRRWPEEKPDKLKIFADHLSDFDIDHSIGPALQTGGQQAAYAQMQLFLGERFRAYVNARSQPQQEGTSGLSSYLHFGHISAHEIFAAVAELERWNPGNVASKPNGSARGWWGMSDNAEGFLDELISWRELGYNMCWQRSDYDRYPSLPAWARATLAEHVSDKREFLYSLDEFEQSRTHDALWNAAQQQLVREGRMHNYLRMLWGKKILEWSASPQDALAVMIELNNKYAVDGRDPNSYSGIFWVLGRYDRPWGPERPVFGKIRYMSSENTARKVKVDGYIRKYSNLSKEYRGAS
jgi:deoxyribodipyrimidine photo-lyase